MEIRFLKPAAPLQSFVLAKPDVVISGRLRTLLDGLEASGFRVTSWLARRAGEEDIRRFHDRGRFQWWHDDWQLNSSLFSHGPAAGLLLTSPNAQASDLHVKLRARKGGALPETWHAESLRYAIGRSRVCNAIHIADDADEVVEEALHWFRLPAPGLQSLSVAEPMAADTLLQRLADHDYLSGQRFDGHETILRVMIRTLDAALVGLAPSSAAALAAEQIRRRLVRIAAELSGATGRLERESVWQRGRPGLCDDAAAFQNSLERTGSATDSALSNTAQVYLTMLRPPSFCVECLQPLWYLVSLWSTYISELERFLITSSCRYSPSSWN